MSHITAKTAVSGFTGFGEGGYVYLNPRMIQSVEQVSHAGQTTIEYEV